MASSTIACSAGLNPESCRNAPYPGEVGLEQPGHVGHAAIHVRDHPDLCLGLAQHGGDTGFVVGLGAGGQGELVLGVGHGKHILLGCAHILERALRKWIWNECS
jgi:hypothetical protein